MRIRELDFVKCVLIILMIVFHLAYIGDMYPDAKRIVYTFHMSGFLIISGYLANVNKEGRVFVADMLRIFIPYMLMETAYTCMASVLPVRERLADVSVWVYLKNILVSPLGPYWYLHTLMLCTATYYLTHRLSAKMDKMSAFVIFALCLYALSKCSLLVFGNAVYFMIGVGIRQYGLNVRKVFPPSPLMIVPLVLLCTCQDNLDRTSLGGVAITYCAVSLLMSLHDILPSRLRCPFYFVGRNTLPILLFSPIFTFASKYYLSLFAFDSTGICYMLVTVVVTIAGCLMIAYCLERMCNTLLLFGGKKL